MPTGTAPAAPDTAGRIPASRGTKVATDELGWGTSVTDAWQTVPGSTLGVAVPSGKVRLVTARFNGESSCSGSGWCALRIVARKAGTSTLRELRPRSDTEFEFDSGGGETYEGTSAHRSDGFGAGTWWISVRARMVSSGSWCLDDWHFELSVHSGS